MTAIGGHGAEKDVHKLSFKGNMEQVVMDTSCSKWGEVLCMFWKRPLVCKREGGSPEAPQKEMSPGIVEGAKAFPLQQLQMPACEWRTAWVVGHMRAIL